jgi:hypothetical protein
MRVNLMTEKNIIAASETLPQSIEGSQLGDIGARTLHTGLEKTTLDTTAITYD